MSSEIDRIRGSLSRLERQYGDTDKAAGAATGGAESFVMSVGKIASGIGLATIAMQGFSAAQRLVVESAVGLNSTLETATLQFKILMGDADQAAAHVKSLFEFAKATPFETGPIIQASRILQVMGGDALNTAENLRMVGDAAAGTSAPFQEVANWVGRAYTAIQSGKPFGEAAMRLQELGILSGEARARVEALTEAGVDSERVWAQFQSELGRFGGSMKEMQGTMAGLSSTFQDTINIMMAGALAPAFEELKIELTNVNEFLESDTAQQWGQDFAESVREAVRMLREAKDLMVAIANAQRTGSGAVTGAAQTVIGANPLLQLMGAALGQGVENARMGTEAATAFWDAFTAEHSARVGMMAQHMIPASARDDWRLEGREAGETYGEGVAEGAETAAAGINFSDRLMAALGIQAAANQLGTGGAELMDALAKGIEANSDKTASEVAQAADKIMQRWLKELDPTVARQRAAELTAALASGLDDVEALLRRTQGEAEARRAAQDQQRDAERAAKDAQRAAEVAARDAQREAERMAREAQREAELAVREAERIAREAANTSANGLMSAFAENRANINALMGDLATGAGQALEAAFRENTMSAGAGLGRELENLIDLLRREGVENWRELGDDYAGALLEAVATGTDAAKMDALAALNELGGIIEAARAENKRLLDEAKAGERLGEIDTALAERRADITRDAAQAVAEAEAALRISRQARGEQEAMAARHKAELDAIRGQAQGKDAGAADARALRDAAEAINRARFGGNSLEILRAMKAEQEAIERIAERGNDQERRLSIEAQIAAVRMRHEQEIAAERERLENEALARTRGQIGTRAAGALDTAEANAARDRGRVVTVGTINQHFYGPTNSDEMREGVVDVMEEVDMLLSQAG